MLRSLRLPLTLALVALAAWTAPTLAQNQNSNPVTIITRSANPPPKPPEPTALALTPATVPVPALKYRLLPLTSELNPGDAAPIYLRIRHETLDKAWFQIGEKSSAWLALPLDKFPKAEARAFVDGWSGKLRQIEFGAHRQTCDWSYTLPEQREDAYNIMLPDAQSMRQWERLLALKARVEVAEGKYDDAIHTTETSLAFARHVAGGPFLINELVGIAIASSALAQIEELVGRPGAPNLYWALTSLPRPLISLRHGFETERKVIEWILPELTDLDRPRTEAEWKSRLDQLHSRLVRWNPGFMTGDEKAVAALKAVMGPDAATLTRQSLDHARAYLQKRDGLTKEQVERLPASQAVLLFMAGSYRERRDELFKAGYLDYPEARAVYKAMADRTDDPAVQIITTLLPAVQAVHQAGVRLDRKIAALRVIEALRIHAAAHQGKLPDTLDKITEVPVPLAPATRKPFLYSRDGDAALLSCPPSDMTPPWPSYRLTIRPADGAKK